MLGLALVVDDVSKGQRLAFRYSSVRRPGAPPSDDAGLALFGPGDDDFAKLFRPKPALCGRVFELTIDDLHFVSFPTLRTDDRAAELSLFNFVFILPAPLWSRRRAAPPCSSRYVQSIRDCVSVLARVAAAEEQRCHYVSQQARLMLQIHDTHVAERSTDGTALVQALLERCELAREIRCIADGLREHDVARLRFNGWRPLLLDTRGPTRRADAAEGAARTQGEEVGPASPPVADKAPHEPWRPYHALLLLRPRKSVLAACGGAHASRALRAVVLHASPSLSLAELAAVADTTEEQVATAARHLTHWQLARRVHALGRGSLLYVHPEADLGTGSAPAAAFAAAFPRLDLWRVLAAVNHMPSWPDLASYYGARKAESVVSWLLAHRLLQQRHVHAFLLVDPRLVDAACARCGLGAGPEGAGTDAIVGGPPLAPGWADDRADAAVTQLAGRGKARPDLLALLRGAVPLLDGTATAADMAHRLGVPRSAVVDMLRHFREHVAWTLLPSRGEDGEEEERGGGQASSSDGRAAALATSA